MMRQREYRTVAALLVAVFVIASFLQTHQNKRQDYSSRALSGYDRGELSIATFGSYMTWGGGLNNRFDAYPYQLSQIVKNYAHFNTGPHQISVCPETSIGQHEMFDVLIFDYWLDAHEGLAILSRRLKERYPGAVFIYCKFWTLSMYRRKPTESSGHDQSQNLHDWVIQNGLETVERAAFVDAIDKDDGYWYFIPRNDADKTVEEIANEMGGHVVEYPKFESKETLKRYASYFNPPFYDSMSKVAHTVLAEALTIDINIWASDWLKADSSVMGTWGKGDDCYLWYSSGGVNFNMHNMKMVQYAESHPAKYALEVGIAGLLEPGWVEVENNFDDPRELYVSYWTSIGSNVYPKTRVSIVGGVETVELVTTNELDQSGQGIVRTTGVGVLQPGKTRVEFEPLEEGKQLPFRLVGLSFTDGEAVPDEFNFGPVWQPSSGQAKGKK